MHFYYFFLFLFHIFYYFDIMSSQLLSVEIGKTDDSC